MNYFLLVFVLCIPFWLVGGNKLPLPVNLPVSALMFINPAIAASILSYKEQGAKGVKDLLKKTFDYKKTKNRIWYLPALLLVPFIYYLSYAIMRSTGMPLPDPINFPFFLAPVFFIVYFISAAGEELGWSGFAIDPLQDRWGALTASVFLGVVWQIWHVIGDIQAHNTPSWIVWHGLYSVALRILMVWIYNNAGKSVFAAILVHTTDNVSWSLFPNYGSAYDPFLTFIIAFIAVVIVTAIWGTKTLTGYRYTGESRL
jgi:membrane protease YdiL (CAAX protease family)